jgi:DNA polymerase-3 subunit alpha
MADLKSGDLAGAGKGSYTIIGFLKSLREFKDKNGNDMAFGTLTDYEGDIDLVFFSKTWNDCRDLLKLDEIVALKGNIDPANDRNPAKPGFKVSSIADIASLSRSAARKAAASEEPKTAETRKPDTGPKPQMVPLDANNKAVHIRLNTGIADRDENLYPLRDYLTGNPGPRAVFIHVPVSGGEKIIRTVTGIGTVLEGESLGALNDCAGVAEVWRE